MDGYTAAALVIVIVWGLFLQWQIAELWKALARQRKWIEHDMDLVHDQMRRLWRYPIDLEEYRRRQGKTGPNIEHESVAPGQEGGREAKLTLPDGEYALPVVTRIEVIDDHGRILVRPPGDVKPESVLLLLQDEGRTAKLVYRQP